MELDAFDESFDEIWTQEIRRDALEDKLRYESDIQSALYHHLRNWIDPLDAGVQILAEYSPDERSVKGTQRIDLGIQFEGRGDLRIAVEVKWLEGSWTPEAEYDLQKLRGYEVAGARRGYFCYLSTARHPDKIRQIRRGANPKPEDWRTGYLRVAKGFWKTNQPFRVDHY